MTRIIVIAALTVGACASRPRPAPLPALSEVREFVIPWADAFPSDIVVDSTGKVWFTDRLTHRIGSFDPVTETFAEHAIPSRASAPYGMIAAPDGTLWFCESQQGRIGRIDPRTGAIREYLVSPDGGGGPHELVWRNGEIWFTMRERSRYGRLDAKTGETVLYQLERERPYGIAVTRDTIWIGTYTFTIIAVDPKTGTAVHHSLASMFPAVDTTRPESERRAAALLRRGELRRIAADNNGGLWLADRVGSRVLHYDPRTSNIEVIPRGGGPYGITTTAVGHVWWGATGTSQVIGYDPLTRQSVASAAPTKGGFIRDLHIDEKRGRIWLPLSDRGRIGLVMMH